MEILAYCIPSLIVLFATWIVMHSILKNDAERRQWEAKKKTQKEVSMLRLRAYERLTILLERTTPEHMLTEIPVQELTILQLQQRMIQSIKLEFDHNMSQQIYVSDELWDKIILVRDEMASFISSITTQIPPESSSLEYSQLIIQAYKSNGTTPHEIALHSLKNEVQKLF